MNNTKWSSLSFRFGEIEREQVRVFGLSAKNCIFTEEWALELRPFFYRVLKVKVTNKMEKKHWLDTFVVVEDLFRRRCWGTFLFGSFLILGRSALIGGGIASAGYFVSNLLVSNVQTSQLSSTQNSQNKTSSQVVIGTDAKLPIAVDDSPQGVVAGDSTEVSEFNELDWDLNNSISKLEIEKVLKGAKYGIVKN